MAAAGPPVQARYPRLRGGQLPDQIGGGAEGRERQDGEEGGRRAEEGEEVRDRRQRRQGEQDVAELDVALGVLGRERLDEGLLLWKAKKTRARGSARTWGERKLFPAHAGREGGRTVWDKERRELSLPSSSIASAPSLSVWDSSVGYWKVRRNRAVVDWMSMPECETGAGDSVGGRFAQQK